MKTKKTKIACFDIDGTIFRSSLLIELMKSLVYYKIFSKKAIQELNDEYFAWVERRGCYEDYIDKALDLFQRQIKGKEQKEIRKISKKVIDYFKDRVYVYTRDLIAKLRKTYFLISISGSIMEMVKEYNKHLRFDKVFGTVFESNKGIYTGRKLIDAAIDKEKIFKEFIQESKFSLKNSIGVGDTEKDLGFLKYVERPIVFNPNSNLERIAWKNGWEIIVERKDVVYKIKDAKCRVQNKD